MIFTIDPLNAIILNYLTWTEYTAVCSLYNRKTDYKNYFKDRNPKFMPKLEKLLLQPNVPFDLFSFLFSPDDKWIKTYINNAIISHNFHIADHLLTFTKIDDNTLVYACKNGNIKAMKYILETTDSQIQIHTLTNIAIVNGQLDVVKFLIKKYKDIAIGDDAFDMACLNNQYDIMVYLHKMKYHEKCGYITKQWIYGSYVPNSSDLANKVAQMGHIKILRYLYVMGMKCDQIGLNYALNNSNIEIIKLIYKHNPGLTIGHSHYKRAIETKNSKMIKFLAKYDKSHWK